MSDKSLPGPAPGKRRGRPRSREADESILVAALALFLEQGVEGVTIEQTAKRAGVTRATVYRRWPSREALLAQAIARVREEVEQSLGAWEDAPLAELLGWLVEAAPRALARPAARKLLARLIGSVASHPQLISSYWNETLLPRRQAFAKILEGERTRGSLPPSIDADVLQDLIAGALLWHVMIQPGERSAREIRSYLRRVLGQLGLRAGRATITSRHRRPAHLRANRSART
jgi:AcrR family transcriptional regulator